MASLTIRKLDDAIRSPTLRLRSAKNGRSVEEEVRVILRELARAALVPAAPASSPGARADRPARSRWPCAGQPSVTLIIGGGIAAYKALDLIRRLKERHIEVRCVLTKAAQQFVTPLAASALSHERVYTDLFDPEQRVRRRPYPSGARMRSDRGGAGDRRPDGEDGAGPRRRSRQRDPAGGQPADPAGARHEPADVEQPRHPPQRAAAPARRRFHRSAPMPARWPSAGEAGVGRMVGGDRNRGRRRPTSCVRRDHARSPASAY